MALKISREATYDSRRQAKNEYKSLKTIYKKAKKIGVKEIHVIQPVAFFPSVLGTGRACIVYPLPGIDLFTLLVGATQIYRLSGQKCSHFPM